MSSMRLSVKKTALGKRVGFYSHLILNNSLKREGTCTMHACITPKCTLFPTCFFVSTKERYRPDYMRNLIVICDVVLHYQVLHVHRRQHLLQCIQKCNAKVKYIKNILYIFHPLHMHTCNQPIIWQHDNAKYHKDTDHKPLLL